MGLGAAPGCPALCHPQMPRGSTPAAPAKPRPLCVYVSTVASERKQKSKSLLNLGSPRAPRVPSLMRVRSQGAEPLRATCNGTRWASKLQGSHIVALGVLGTRACGVRVTSSHLSGSSVSLPFGPSCPPTPLHTQQFSPSGCSSRDTLTTRQRSRGLKIAKKIKSSLHFSQATKALWVHLGQQPSLACRHHPASHLEISNEAPWRILDFPPCGGFPWRPLPAGDLEPPGMVGVACDTQRGARARGPALHQPPTAVVGLSSLSSSTRHRAQQYACRLVGHLQASVLTCKGSLPPAWLFYVRHV